MSDFTRKFFCFQEFLRSFETLASVYYFTKLLVSSNAPWPYQDPPPPDYLILPLFSSTSFLPSLIQALCSNDFLGSVLRGDLISPLISVLTTVETENCYFFVYMCEVLDEGKLPNICRFLTNVTLITLPTRFFRFSFSFAKEIGQVLLFSFNCRFFSC